MYLWERPAAELAAELIEKVNVQQSYLKSSGIYANCCKAMRYYYGQFYDGSSSHGLGYAGEQSELITTAVNHLRSLTRHSLDLVTQENLVFDATSENSDPSVRDQASVAESVLNHYFYERSFGNDVFDALELATLCGTSYLEVYWEEKHKILGGADNQLFFVGTPKFRPRSLLDVTVDKLFESKWERQNWVVVRDLENRWDLIKRFPKLADMLEGLPAASDDASYNSAADEDSVWFFRAYHRESAALPQGRAIFFVEDGTVISEFKVNGKPANPYVDLEAASTPNGGIPVLCLRPQVRHGCHHGYTKVWDLIPIQEMHNLLASTIATNQANFGLQHIAVPRDSRINRAVMAGGTAIYEYDMLEGGAGLPTPLNLCATPPEVFNFMNDQVIQMETISGVNAIMRGKIDTSIPPTGVASAIFAAQGQIMNSDIEKCYFKAAKESAVMLLYIIAKFQKFEDTILITGRDKTAMTRQFSGKSVEGIRNVKISIGNPLARTMAGRTALMEVMAQYQMIKTPEQMVEVLETGNVKATMEFITAENRYIHDENDMMIQGKEPLGLGSDNHVKHFLMHKVIADNRTVREDPQLLSVVTKHMEFHLDQIDIQMETNPSVFTMILTEGGKVPMPIPAQSTGMTPGAEGAGLPSTNIPADNSNAMSSVLTSPDTADGTTESAAMSAMSSAQKQISKAEQELS